MSNMKIKNQCFNSTIKNKIHKKSSTSSENRTTTCLLCGTVVNLSSFIGIPRNNRKLEELVTNLYKHLEISTSELPPRYTEETLPFCAITCEPLLTRLLEEQAVLDGALVKIKNIVTNIQQKVVDFTILGLDNISSSSAMAKTNTDPKFTKLKDLILEGYKTNISKNYGNLEQISHQVQSNVADEIISLPNSNNYEILDLGEHSDPFSLHHPKIEESYENQSQGNENHDHGSTLFEEKYSWNEFPVADDPILNAEEDPLAIPNENDEMNDVALIETETKTESNVTLDYENEDDQEDDIFTLEDKKRRYFYEGIEVLRLNGTGVCVNMSFLQCTLCNYTAKPFLKSSRYQTRSAYLNLKTHILHVHKRTTGLPKPSRAREMVCIPCNKTFANHCELRKHNALHPDDFKLECDICGRPMKKGTRPINLYAHKFTHKNAEEKRAAILTGEKGAYKRVHLANKKVTVTTNAKKKKMNNSGNETRFQVDMEVDSGV
ncbi:unnamed protein product [Orchesella dallaii]|uniref:C2H2-type domain-containing protein n=1 Tax=Orchesella dallaii TaxID=48710 RepID=A0ABP1RWL0_9HEXA